MSTSRAELSAWFDRGLAEGATHMIVVCDTFDHEDYPVYVKATEDLREKTKEFDGVNMQRIMEVYSMGVDKETQLAEHRAFHRELEQTTR